MKMAKSYKIILLITSALMAFVVAFSMLSFKFAKAEEENPKPTPDVCFDYDTKSIDAEFKDEDSDGKYNAVFTLTKETNTIKVENVVAVNDLYINYKAGTGIETVKVTTTAGSYLANGNVFTDGKLYKDIKNTITVNVADGNAKLNAKDLSTTGASEIYAQVDADGYYKASVDGSSYVKESDKYYRVKASNDYVVLTGWVEIEVTLADGVETADFEIISLSQKASNNEYLQGFEFTAENKLIEASPVISLTDSIKINDAGNKAIIYNEKTVITYNVYSFLDGHVKNTTKMVSSAYVNENEKGEVHFEAGDNQTLKIIDKNIVDEVTNENKVYLTVTLNVLDKRTYEGTAPEYKFDKTNQDDIDAMQSFLIALKNSHTVVDKGEKEDDESDDVIRSISLGSTIEIPSLKDFVVDDTTVYENLKVELNYASPNATGFGTKSEMKLTIDDVGDYMLFVLFKDTEGNTMKKGDFIVSKDGEVDQMNTAKLGGVSRIEEDGSVTANGFIFTMKIKDDAPIIITPAKVQGKGYLGATYTAASFKIEASGCTVTYKLYYNADKDAEADGEGWVEIPASSTVTDVTYNENGYDFNAIHYIAYNGNLTFKPNKTGLYMIECTASSKTTARENVARTTPIKIEERPVVVKPASEWLENNVWSVVFLSIGSLCLIGIIILLCIKPKDKAPKQDKKK